MIFDRIMKHWRALFRKDDLERELDDELLFHLERDAAQNLESGMDPEEARYSALRSFGGVEQAKEECRDARGVRLIQEFCQDIRYGARGLRKHSGFTLISILTLALGIGANVAIFSLVDALLLRPLPFADPDRLMMVYEDASANAFPRGEMAPANYLDIKAQNQVFEDVAALAWGTLSLTGDGEPEQVDSHTITSNLFPLLGVTPMLGRNFTNADSLPGAARTVMLSYGLWQRRFGGDKAIIGRDIWVNNEKSTVVGIMPSNFLLFRKDVELWTPMRILTAQEPGARTAHYLDVVARLKETVTESQAQTNLNTIAQGIAAAYPKNAAGLRAFILPIREQLVGDTRPSLLVLLIAVACILLIACVNLANLQLSRGTARHREMALRAALGARRSRLIRQLLTECVLLALLGLAAGIGLACLSLAFLKQLVPASMSSFADVTINLRLLGYGLALSILTAMLFGIAPAFRTATINLSDALKKGGGGGGFASVDNRLRKALVVSEMALAMVLLVAAGLLARSFVRLRTQELGFRPDNVLLMRTSLPSAKYPDRDRRAQFYQQVIDRVKVLPAVADVAYTTAAPLRWKGGSTGLVVEGRMQEETGALHRQISSDYFRAMGIALVAGRTFDDHDGPQSQQVAIINQTMARQFWPGQDPIGKRFKLSSSLGSDNSWLTIVGFVGDAKPMGMAAPAKAEMYFPYQQDPQTWCAPRDLVIHAATGESLTLTSAVKAAIWEVDSQQPVSRIQTMDQLITQELSNQRVGMTLISALAVLAMLLAAIGIYGVLSFVVTQRTQEIGIRMALGAKRGRILRSVVGDGAKLVAAGACIGLAISFGMSRLMSTLLFGISARDPLTFLVATGVILLVSMFASYVPARRATKVDPLTALRYE